MTRVFLLWLLLPQLTPVAPGEAILKRVETALASVHDYTVSLEITADLENARIPPMHATMYFKEPGRVHFSSEGFALLPKEGFTLTPASILERFRIDSVVGEGEGERVYRLRLVARDERAGVTGGWLRISSGRWTIDGGDLSFSDGRSLSVRYRYEPVGTVWLPSEMGLSFSRPGGVESVPPDVQKALPLGGSLPRRGSITIRFSGYRLNTGLSDEIFGSPQIPPAGTKR